MKLNIVKAKKSKNTNTMQPDLQQKKQFTLPYGEQQQAILLPDASIGTDQLGKYIYVVNDSNIVRYRHIETGQLIGDSLRQIRAGITPRERYVTKALMKVRDGMKVHPIDN